jgi:hypothetical protein
MRAELALRQKDYFEDGSFVEMKVWRVSDPVPPSDHRYKYSLVYIAGGQRVLGYDNERGKGDHRHIGDTEEPIQFNSMTSLIERFIAEARHIRGGRK